MKKLLKILWMEERAENMPEYALLLFLVSLAAVSAVGGVARSLTKIYLSASIQMMAVPNPSLVGGTMGSTIGTPGNPYSNPKENQQKISR